MQQKIKFPNPHSKNQKIVMHAFLMRGLVEMWVACGTKFGKTIAASSAQAGAAWVKHGSLYRWVAPIYPQAKIGFNYMNRIFPPEVKRNNSDPSLKIDRLDTRIEFKSGKFPEDLEGEACNGYVLDECAKMVRQVYDSAKTTTTVTRGPILGISTPRGKNWFYTKCMEAKEHMDWALKNDKSPEKIFITAPTSDNPHVTEEAIEDARRSLPERLFRQYYLAEFIDDGSVFAGFRDCVHGDLLDLPDGTQHWVNPACVDSEVVIGADWGKTEDYTVFIAIDIKTSQVAGFWRFYKVPFTEAVRRLAIFARKFGEVQVAFHDKTGLGQAIDDQLAYTNVPYKGIAFSNKNKADMVAKLITGFEQRMIKIPNWPELIAELDAYEVSVNDLGTMTYNAPSGKHDDIVTALFLAYTAYLEYADTTYEVKFLEDLPFEKRKTEFEGDSLEKFYNDIISEDDDF